MKTGYILLSLALLFAAGCGNDGLQPEGSGFDNSDPFIVLPIDGASSVPTNTQVTLAFAQAVERSVVERGLHLINEVSLADSACPDSSSMGSGDMLTSMMDSEAMSHLDTYHSTNVSILWREDSRSCVITPDSSLMPDTEYMIHIDQAMRSMIDNMMSRMIGMDGMNGIAGHGFAATADGGVAVHFRTGSQ